MKSEKTSLNKTLIGYISAPFGLKGEMKIKTDSDFIDQRFTENHLIILKNHSFEKEFTITSYRIHKNQVLIRINNINDINEITPYIGCEIYSNEEVQIKENEYLVDDLVGLKVFDEEDNLVGIIHDIIKIPSNDILEVVNRDNKLLIPFINDYIKEINDDKIIIKRIEWLK